MSLKFCCWAGLGLYALLSAADWGLTFALLKANPEAFESNPLAAACLEQHGWSGLAVYKVGGVLAFAGAVVLLVRRKPPVAAGVVALGCVVLLGVTGYSHRLLAETHREAERQEVMTVGPPPPAAGAEALAPERCWFAADKKAGRARHRHTAALARAE